MRTLVVGVDGEVPSLHALSWAIEAVGDAGEVHVVAADGVDASESLPPELRDQVATISTVEGPAADALRSSAVQLEADALVVGAHVPLRMMPKRIGRTIHQLLDSMACPIIVVPQVARLDRVRDDPVIVGAGHGEATNAAVCWSAQWADQSDVALGLIRATGEAPTFSMDGFLNLIAYYIDPTQRLTWSREDLTEFAAMAQSSSAGELDIATTAVSGRASSALVDSSGGASLLVVGRHDSEVFGEGHTARLLQHALTHALCPVAVVPPRPTSVAAD